MVEYLCKFGFTNWYLLGILVDSDLGKYLKNDELGLCFSVGKDLCAIGFVFIV